MSHPKHKAFCSHSLRLIQSYADTMTAAEKKFLPSENAAEREMGQKPEHLSQGNS